MRGTDDCEAGDPHRLAWQGVQAVLAENLRQLIVRMVQENPTWGEERIAAELSVKLGILVLPERCGRTGRKRGIREAVGEQLRSTRGRLSAITPRPSWPLTSW
jgi:hypothetical protein